MPVDAGGELRTNRLCRRSQAKGEIAMKVAVIVARVLLGVVFVFAGFTKVVPVMPMQPMPGDLGAMLNLMVAHKWIFFYGVFELVSGLLLLAGRFVPLALTLLAALLVNILLFNVTLAPSAVGIVAVLVLGALEIFLVWAYRESFAGVLSARAQPRLTA